MNFGINNGNNGKDMRQISLRKKCPYPELFWSGYSRIWNEYGESFSLLSVRIRENTDQNNSEYEHFSRNDS